MDAKDISNEEIEKMLSEAYLSDDDEKSREIARGILEKDPDNPEAHVLMADSAADDEDKVAHLERALEIAKRNLPDGYLDMGEGFLEDEAGMLYIGVMQRLGFVLLAQAETQRALEIAEEIMGYDEEDETFARTLFYRCLLEMGDYEGVLRYARKDAVSSPGEKHSRAISLFSLYGPSEQFCQALWDIFSIEPDIPFYIIGYWVEPDDVDVAAVENYNFSVFFEDPWTRNDELLGWLTRATVIFGYFTNRFNRKTEENIDSLLNELEIQDAIRQYSPEIEDSLEDINPVDIHEKDSVVLSLLRSRECSYFTQ